MESGPSNTCAACFIMLLKHFLSPYIPDHTHVGTFCMASPGKTVAFTYKKDYLCDFYNMEVLSFFPVYGKIFIIKWEVCYGYPDQ